jgi:hypothetical protein
VCAEVRGKFICALEEALECRTWVRWLEKVHSMVCRPASIADSFLEGVSGRWSLGLRRDSLVHVLLE